MSLPVGESSACSVMEDELRQTREKDLMPVSDDLLANNTRYAEKFEKGDLPLPPGLHLAVVACMDARLDSHSLLGIRKAMSTSSGTPVAW